jgi:dihydroxyacid dehydratase/phosphogluconate dehydratase
MITNYFTFGQTHFHKINGIIFDKNCVVKITAEDPRQVMFDTFGKVWSMHYDSLEDIKLEYYPRGVIELNL